MFFSGDRNIRNLQAIVVISLMLESIGYQAFVAPIIGVGIVRRVIASSAPLVLAVIIAVGLRKNVKSAYYFSLFLFLFPLITFPVWLELRILEQLSLFLFMSYFAVRMSFGILGLLILKNNWYLEARE